MGGITAELLRDVATLVLPATEAEIGQALTGLRLAPLLTGYRGRAPADMAAALAAITALCALAEADPSIDEIEINPLMLAPDGGGALAVDAVIWKSEDIED